MCDWELRETPLTHYGADKVVLCVDLEVVFQVRLSEEHSVTVLVGTAELLRLFVDLQVFSELLLCGKGLVAPLK